MNDDSLGAPLVYAVLDEELLPDFADFSCGDDEWQTDLREFLLDDALPQARGRFSVTFVFYTNHTSRSDTSHSPPPRSSASTPTSDDARHTR